MTLRQKTLLIISATFAVFALLLYGSMLVVLKRNFKRIDDRIVDRNVERALDALARLGKELESTGEIIAGVYASTRDLQSLVTLASRKSDVDAIAYFDAGGEPQINQFLRSDKVGAIPFPEVEDPFSLLDAASGLVVNESQKMLVGATALDGGVLVLGRLLDSPAIKSIAEQIHLAIDLRDVSDPGLPEDYRLAHSQLTGAKKITSRILDDHALGGYALVRDLRRNPALLLRVILPRDIAASAKQTSLYLMWNLLIGGVVFAAVTLHLLQKHILSRLVGLNDRIAQIAQSNDSEARLPVVGSDEISQLGATINEMLAAIEFSRRSLREGQERHRAVVEQLAEGILLIDVTTRCVTEANAAIQRLLGYGEEEIVRLPLHALLLRSARAEMDEQIENLLFDGGHLTNERQYVRKDGSLVFVQATVTVIAHGGRNAICLLLHDISERKRTQAALQLAHEKLEQRVAERTVELSRANSLLTASLKEKEVLLKEIHHRVKNNLQVISSLLNLQASFIHDKEVLTIFIESRNRVRSMALVHEKLYQSKDLARIDFADYIRALTIGLLSSFAGKTSSVRVSVEIDGIMLGVDSAVPCGLIVNELVSNSFKYAFPEGRRGEICVAMEQSQERLRLTVSDDGIGFPGKINFRNTESLGLQLVNTLTEQLEGEIELKNGRGTIFAICFPKTPET
jgi:PAS domain S-box-containing protein